MDREKLHQQLLVVFADELTQHVETFNTEILQLESAAGATDVDESLTKLFRAAHSLKGASRAVELPSIERICHDIEDVLNAIRDQSVEFSSELASVILTAVDRIAAAGNVVRTGDTPVEDYFGDLPKQLQNAASGKLAKQSLPDPSIPSPEQPRTPISDSPSEPSPSEPSPSGPSPSGPSASGPSASDSSNQSSKAIQRPRTASVRVAEEKLDSLMAQAGELLVARQQLEIRPSELELLVEWLSDCRAEFHSVQRSLLTLIQHSNDPLLNRSARFALRMEDIVENTGDNLRRIELKLQELHRTLLADSRQLNHAGEALQQDIHRIRMLPFVDGCAGLDRVVRDVASDTGKQVDFAIEGGEIEVDRMVLEGLRDPLMHLIRNAVDHGLELPEERARAGKSASGSVTLSASLRGSQVDIVVGDDGRGLDRGAIRDTLKASGLPVPTDDRELLRSVFAQGFSTASEVTDWSGRGVGMDVVRSQVEALHGTIDLSTQPGQGTRFSLSVPLTLTSISALFVRVGEQIYGVPSTNVRQLVRFRPAELRTLNGQKVVSLDGPPLPVMTLAKALQLPDPAVSMQRDHLTAIVVGTGDHEMVLVVDQLIGERDAIVKNLGPQVRRVRHVSGATLLRTGRVALLLSIATVIRANLATTADILTIHSDTKTPTGPVKHRILVVDDSLTTRSMVKSILESAGYDVVAAVDGQDAWARLQNIEVELVVSDVDMPRMDGIMLTTQIRNTPRLKDIPVILVTSRDSDEDKERGEQAGANSYLVKSAFHQSSILDAIEQLLYNSKVG